MIAGQQHRRVGEPESGEAVGDLDVVRVGGSELGQLCLLLTEGPGSILDGLPLSLPNQQGAAPGTETNSGSLPGLSELLDGLRDPAQSGTSTPEEPPAEGSPEGATGPTSTGATGEAAGDDSG